jgi:hypothetical protein
MRVKATDPSPTNIGASSGGIDFPDSDAASTLRLRAWGAAKTGI